MTRKFVKRSIFFSILRVEHIAAQEDPLFGWGGDSEVRHEFYVGFAQKSVHWLYAPWTNSKYSEVRTERRNHLPSVVKEHCETLFHCNIWQGVSIKICAVQITQDCSRNFGKFFQFWALSNLEHYFLFVAGLLLSRALSEEYVSLPSLARQSQQRLHRKERATVQWSIMWMPTTMCAQRSSELAIGRRSYTTPHRRSNPKCTKITLATLHAVPYIGSVTLNRDSAQLQL